MMTDLENALKRYNNPLMTLPTDDEIQLFAEAARLYHNLIGQGLRQEQSVSSQRWITDWAAFTPQGDER